MSSAPRVSGWASFFVLLLAQLQVRHHANGSSSLAFRYNSGIATASRIRLNLVRRGQRLEYFTVAYNSIEGLVSIVSGLISGSVSLVGFGLDSVIEVISGAALLWRLHHDLNPSRRDEVERTTLRIVGWCFMAISDIGCFFFSGPAIFVTPKKIFSGYLIIGNLR